MPGPEDAVVYAVPADEAKVSAPKGFSRDLAGSVYNGFDDDAAAGETQTESSTEVVVDIENASAAGIAL